MNLFALPIGNSKPVANGRDQGALVGRVLIGAALQLATGVAAAWTDHDMLSRQSLAGLPQMQRVVVAEPIEGFLMSDPAKLAALLDAEERWAREHLANYPPRPDALRLPEHVSRDRVLERFLEATRINPNVRLKLFVQDLPGIDAVSQSKIAWTEVTPLRSETMAKEISFSALLPGNPVTVLDVVGTASDEPDYGLDIGLWADNTTGVGQAYGFGRQPFGNPKLENSTQAPFHMGFFHESWLMTHAAPYLAGTLPEYRVHLYQTLADFAFRTGHPYWGWRFAGWSLHYVQDLTQPYHAKALPGVGPVHVILASAADLLGIHGPKNAAVQLVSNRHLVLENYEYHRIRSAMAAHRDSDTFISALNNSQCDRNYGPWREDSLRTEVSLEANRSADQLDATLADAVPAHLVSDPHFAFTESDPNVPNLEQVMLAASTTKREELDAAVAAIMCHVGAQTRRFVSSYFPVSERSG
jgi:hypothetical protein